MVKLIKLNLLLKNIIFFKKIRKNQLIAIDEHLTVIVFTIKLNEQGQDQNVYKVALSKKFSMDKPVVFYGENKPNLIDYRLCQSRRTLSRVNLIEMLDNPDYSPFLKHFSDYKLEKKEFVRFCISFNRTLNFIFSTFILIVKNIFWSLQNQTKQFYLRKTIKS